MEHGDHQWLLSCHSVATGGLKVLEAFYQPLISGMVSFFHLGCCGWPHVPSLADTTYFTTCVLLVGIPEFFQL